MTSSNGNIFRITGPIRGNPPVGGGLPAQRLVTRSFDVFFDLRLHTLVILDVIALIMTSLLWPLTIIGCYSIQSRLIDTASMYYIAQVCIVSIHTLTQLYMIKYDIFVIVKAGRTLNTSLKYKYIFNTHMNILFVWAELLYYEYSRNIRHNQAYVCLFNESPLRQSDWFGQIFVIYLVDGTRPSRKHLVTCAFFLDIFWGIYWNMYIMPTREYITFRIKRSLWFIESVHLLFPFSHSASHNVCSLFQISVIKYNVASIVSTSENLGDCSMHFGMGFRSNTNKGILWHFPGELRCNWGPHNACQPRLMTYVLHYSSPWSSYINHALLDLENSSQYHGWLCCDYKIISDHNNDSYKKVESRDHFVCSVLLNVVPVFI